MDDLNDFYFFVKVVDSGGFSAASRTLNVPKSRLSRRISALEEQYGVRLLQRSTRHFSVTETGREFYLRCQAMLVEAEAARQVMELRRAEPQGIVRMSCPTALLEYRIADLVGGFMMAYPKVQVHLEASNRRVDVLGEGLDMAIRVRFPPLEDSDLAMRVLCGSPQHLVAAPALIEQYGQPTEPLSLNAWPSLDWGPAREHCWDLTGPDGEIQTVRHAPRLITDDMTALRLAALRGVGVVQLPRMVVQEDFRAGRLLDVLPGWAPKGGLVHVVFPSRRGILPGVRLLIDYLAEHINKD